MKKTFCLQTKSIRYTPDISVQLIDDLCQLCIDLQQMMSTFRSKMFHKIAFPDHFVLSQRVDASQVHNEMAGMEDVIHLLVRKVYQYAKRRQFELGEGQELIKDRIERRLVQFQKRESGKSRDMQNNLHRPSLSYSKKNEASCSKERSNEGSHLQHLSHVGTIDQIQSHQAASRSPAQQSLNLPRISSLPQLNLK